MLKKYSDPKFLVGTKVSLLTRTKEVIATEIVEVLGDLVSLKGLPPGAFSIDGDRLKPNWCEGRKMYREGVLER